MAQPARALLQRCARDPAAWVVLAFLTVCLVGIDWGIPCTDSWAADTLSPRASGLAAIAECYLPGHAFRYPPLHLLILTLASLPEILVAIVRVGTDQDALARELILPGYMTPIELSARVVAVVMAVGIVINTMRLWSAIVSRRAGIAAGVVVGVNPVFVYYAHTGNLEVPYLFWSTWAMVEVDRVLRGQAREVQVLLLATAAVLTKDQSSAAFLLVIPFSLVVFPLLSRGAARRAVLLRKPLWKAVALAVGAYLLVSGALVNPSGFRARLGILFGPASQDWATYPRGLGGAVSILRDMVLSIPRYTSWPIALAAMTGLVLLLRHGTGTARARAVMPFVAALSFTLFFTVAARRTEDRFVLPQAILFFPYAAVVFHALARRLTTMRGRLLLAVVSISTMAPAVVGVASMDATLLGDARYEAERFLSTLPAGAKLEIYGGPHFLPRLPSKLILTRVGSDPIDGRSNLPGVTEILDPGMSPGSRSPDYILVSTEFAHSDVVVDTRKVFGVSAYTDEASLQFFTSLYGGALGYERVLRARCNVPWPLTPRQVHGSTGGEIWIFRRRQAI